MKILLACYPTFYLFFGAELSPDLHHSLFGIMGTLASCRTAFQGMSLLLILLRSHGGSIAYRQLAC